MPLRHGRILHPRFTSHQWMRAVQRPPPWPAVFTPQLGLDKINTLPTAFREGENGRLGINEGGNWTGLGIFALNLPQIIESTFRFSETNDPQIWWKSNMFGPYFAECRKSAGKLFRLRQQSIFYRMGRIRRHMAATISLPLSRLAHQSRNPRGIGEPRRRSPLHGMRIIRNKSPVSQAVARPGGRVTAILRNCLSLAPLVP